MATFSDHEQRKLDIKAGEELDRRMQSCVDVALHAIQQGQSETDFVTSWYVGNRERARHAYRVAMDLIQKAKQRAYSDKF